MGTMVIRSIAQELERNMDRPSPPATPLDVVSIFISGVRFLRRMEKTLAQHSTLERRMRWTGIRQSGFDRRVSTSELTSGRKCLFSTSRRTAITGVDSLIIRMSEYSQLSNIKISQEFPNPDHGVLGLIKAIDIRRSECPNLEIL